MKNEALNKKERDYYTQDNIDNTVMETENRPNLLRTAAWRSFWARYCCIPSRK